MDKKGQAGAFRDYITWVIIIVVGILVILFFPKLSALMGAAWDRITNIGFS